MFFTPRKTNCKLQTANFLGCFTCFKHGGNAYGKQGYFIWFVRNNFQFSLHFLAEKFCSMKSFPYLCSVKKDEDGDLIGRHANAQRAVRSLRRLRNHVPSLIRP